jgi:phosphoadenosine phosphosulfate reductase
LRLFWWAKQKADLSDETPQTAEEIIQWAADRFGARLALVTSFQREGMVILDIAARLTPAVPVFTLDTGRLPEATYRMMETVRQRYGVTIHLIYPEAVEAERMTTRHGPNLFRNDVGFRLLCCQIRKVRPLDRALAGFEATLVGLRREQSETRGALAKVDWHATPVKIAPLANWSAQQVSEYSALHRVPEHPMYVEGYQSIGCDPCTRATAAGEGERAGRWWWETDAAKECGLHFTPEGAVRRHVDVLLEEVIAPGA